MLTFFSGFGLGTILTPVFIFYFPVEVAIALTGVVHLLNNCFKLILIGRNINPSILLKFGLTAIVGAYFGAQLLFYFSGYKELLSFELIGHSFAVAPINMLVGALLFIFALTEIIPVLSKPEFSTKILIPGGVISGFFGGLSGHQGALRTAFLVNCGLTKEAFIATGVAIACLVDITRIPVYFSGMSIENLSQNIPILSIAVISAFAGALIGKRLLKKVTMRLVQVTVGIMISLIGISLMLGLI